MFTQNKNYFISCYSKHQAKIIFIVIPLFIENIDFSHLIVDVSIIYPQIFHKVAVMVHFPAT